MVFARYKPTLLALMLMLTFPLPLHAQNQVPVSEPSLTPSSSGEPQPTIDPILTTGTNPFLCPESSDAESSGEQSDACSGPTSPTEKRCCLCRYEEILECASYTDEKSCVKAKPNGKVEDCEWKDPECHSEFEPRCGTYTDKTSCADAMPDGKTKVCKWKEPSCHSRFKLRCESIRGEKDALECDLFELSSDTWVGEMPASFTACTAINYWFAGHGPRCFNLGRDIRACVTCTSGDCRGVHEACSTFRNQAEVQAFIRTVQAALRPGQEVVVRAHQATALLAGECDSYLTLVIRADGYEEQLIDCSDMGMKQHGKRYCFESNEIARCWNSQDKKIETQICCLTNGQDTAGNNIFAWQTAADPSLPACPNTISCEGLCYGNASAEEEGPQADLLEIAEAEFDLCEDLVSDECEDRGGTFKLGVRVENSPYSPYYEIAQPWFCRSQNIDSGCTAYPETSITRCFKHAEKLPALAAECCKGLKVVKGVCQLPDEPPACAGGGEQIGPVQTDEPKGFNIWNRHNRERAYQEAFSFANQAAFRAKEALEVACERADGDYLVTNDPLYFYPDLTSEDACQEYSDPIGRKAWTCEVKTKLVSRCCRNP